MAPHQQVLPSLEKAKNDVHPALISRADLSKGNPTSWARRTSNQGPGVVEVVYKKQRFLLDPEGGKRMGWDIISMFFLVYSIMMVPLRIAFQVNEYCWSDDMAAKVSSPDSIAPLIVRSMYGMGNQLRVLLSYRCQPRDLPIFVATDNKHTQERFVQRYGSHRIKGIKPITKAFEPLVNGVVDRAAISGKVGDAGGGVISNDVAFRCEDVHRHTPLFDAVVDIFTCVQAKAFKGSFYSSFSDAIMRLRNVRGTASEDDEHDLTLPDFHVQYAGNSHDASVSLDDPRLIERAREMAAELSAATTPIS